MGERERFERVVASLREAQLDDAHWPAASAWADDLCGTFGSHLAVIGGDSPADAKFLFGKLYKRGEPDEALERLYVENYLAIDERMPRYFRMADGELNHVANMFTDRERAESPTYNDFLIPTGAENSLTTHMGGPGGLHIIWQLASSGDVSRWTTDRLATIRRLLPHIRHFVKVRQALADAGASAVRTTAAALGAKRIGIVLLDRRGRIAETNDHAATLLLADDGLMDLGGHLTTRHPPSANMLAGLIAAALRPAVADAAGGTMPVRRLGRPSLVLHVSPLSATNVDLGALGGFAVMVLIVDPLDQPRVNDLRVARALDLTPAQARIAAALASGGTVRSIATASHRSEAVVRWHLKQMMARLELSGQTDLVRLVLTTPGVFDR